MSARQLGKCLVFGALIGALFLFPIHISALEYTIQNATPSGNTIGITATISGATNTNCPNSTCYLFAALRQGSDDNFGETKNNQGEWIAYTSKPDKDFVKAAYYMVTLVDGAWNGTLQARFDPVDSAYNGPGDYTLTLMRFTGNSSTPAGDSPTMSLTLSESVPIPTPSPQPSPTPSPSPTPTPTPTPTPSPTPSPPSKASPKPSPSPTATASAGLFSFPDNSPEILGASSSSQSAAGNTKWLAWVLIGLGASLIAVSGAIFGYNQFYAAKSKT